MSSSTPPILPDDAELLAAEYVLGLTDSSERAEAQRRLTNDTEFAAAVARWEERVAPWFDEAGERAHSSTLHDRIMTKLSSAAPIAANDDMPVGRGTLNLWRGAALLMTAATLALAVMLTMRGPVEQTEIAAAPAPILLATLALPDAAAISVSVDQTSGRIVATPVGIEADGAHDHELWLVPATGTPRSLGLVDPASARSLTIDAPLLAELRAGATIAVSFEPVGGSRQAGPSGPVLTAGPLREI